MWVSTAGTVANREVGFEPPWMGSRRVPAVLTHSAALNWHFPTETEIPDRNRKSLNEYSPSDAWLDMIRSYQPPDYPDESFAVFLDVSCVYGLRFGRVGG
jgi:hypothetical protein